jgi:hypothetical protein
MAATDEDELKTLPRRFSYISRSSEEQTNAASKVEIVTIDSLKTSSSGIDQPLPNDSIPIFSIGKIYKNLFLLSFAFILMFTAYNGISTLQSSLNVKNNVGVNSLLITYSFLIVKQLNQEKHN